MLRPVITFLTDFGADSAAAICRGVMLEVARDAQIVDISHSVRKYAIRDGAYLLWCALPWMPVGVHVAVIDPGVGTARLPIGIRTGRGDLLVGPNNGLLVPAAERLGGIVEVRALENRALMLPRTTATFHGRDIFAPVAAHLAVGRPFDEIGPLVDPGTIVLLSFPDPVVTAGALDTSVVYIDSFGNLRLAGDPVDLAKGIGELIPGRRLRITFEATGPTGPIVETTPWAATFGQVEPGRSLLYEDSFGRLAYADNQGDVARRLGLGVDSRARIESA
jgi:S-adenosyl-L-methionine hydrolase (adenosine-forming)